MRDRFEIDLLDPDDPFEIDERNRPHLYKHLPIGPDRRVSVGVEDILDAYHYGDPMYDPAQEDGAADWLMIGEIPEITLVVPLAPPLEPDPKKCRPIGLYEANEDERRRHREWMRRGKTTTPPQQSSMPILRTEGRLVHLARGRAKQGG